MRYLSVCSGIEAATVAWKPMGFHAAGFAEIEKFPSAVLKHHYPEVKNFGDFTKIEANDVGAIDILVGGTPCQSFSVAGLRGGMDDDRGKLALEFLRLAARTRPRWVVWENVPGVLSSNGGRDFGSFLGGLVELGYGFAYRVLDAQHFGIPQRRRRVFVVGYLGDWRRAAAVLFERHSLSGYPPPRRETRERITRGIEIGPSGGSFTETSPTLDARCRDGFIRNQLGVGAAELIPSTGDISHCLNAGGMGRQDYETETLVTHSLRAEGFDASEGCLTPSLPQRVRIYGVDGQAPTLQSEEGRGHGVPTIAFSAKDHGADAMEDCSPTLRAGGHTGSHANAGVMPAVAIQSVNMVRDKKQNGIGISQGDAMYSLTGRDQHGVMTPAMAVRRLLPEECEALQGFPRGYTKITEKTADGPRYKALGNSFAIPVVRWIGQRILSVQGE